VEEYAEEPMTHPIDENIIGPLPDPIKPIIEPQPGDWSFEQLLP
jgi:hypothetical protein